MPVVSTRAAPSSRPGSTSFNEAKLVEPACERQRVGRVETSCGCPGCWGRVLPTGCQGWFRLGLLLCRGPAQPASMRQTWLSRLVCFVSWSCRNHGDFVRGFVVGFVFRVPVVSTRAAPSSRPGSTSFNEAKLVEPACERQRVGRVETSCGCPGCWGRVLPTGCQGWFRLGSLVPRGPAQPAWRGVLAARLNQLGEGCSRPGSTSLERGTRVLAQPAWEEGRSRAGSIGFGVAELDG